MCTITPEYLALHPANDPQEPYKDFQYDFGKGWMRLLPSDALMTLDLGSRTALSLQHAACVSAEDDLGEDLADRIFQATATIPSLMAFRSPPTLKGTEGPWDITRGRVRGGSHG